MKYIIFILLLIATQIRAQPWPKGDTKDVVDLGLRVRWCRYNVCSYEQTDPGETFSYKEAVQLDQEAKKKGYRLPTIEDWTELLNNCDVYYSQNYYGTGIDGFLFTSMVPGYQGKQIFFPMSGYKVNNKHYRKETYSLVRLSTPSGRPGYHKIGHLSSDVTNYVPDYDKTNEKIVQYLVITSPTNMMDAYQAPIRFVNDYRKEIVVK